MSQNSKFNVKIRATRAPFGHFSGFRSGIGTKSYCINNPSELRDVIWSAVRRGGRESVLDLVGIEENVSDLGIDGEVNVLRDVAGWVLSQPPFASLRN